MFVAINEAEERVFAQKSLPRDVQYSCPVCGGAVRLRAGDNNVAHFAHIHACTDTFTHDMSEWHKAWQMMFPLKNREVVITHGNETHRADVLCYGTVIEFQHSPISESEFQRRNEFYTSAGYKVVWIFDAIDLYSVDGRISYIDEWQNRWDNGAKFTWKHPWRFLSGFMPQDEKSVDIFFQLMPFGNDPKSEEADSYMEKVVWVNTNYKTLWGWFHTSYTATNYADLLAWLKERRSRKNGNATENAAGQKNYKYHVDGKVIEAAEFDDFLKEHYPFHVLEDGQWNSHCITRIPGEPGFSCPDPHQKPRISANMCRLGCKCCFAFEELSETKRYIYCQHPLPKGKEYYPKVFRRVYE